jgi:uracil-DNA glycosylase
MEKGSLRGSTMWAALIRYIADRPKTRSRLTSAQKQKALKRLAKKRQQTDPNVLFGKQYYCVGEFAGGIYDCDDHVSPWSKSAQNVDATIMVVGQDWSSEDRLREPINYHRVEHGYDPDVVTNKNLQRLLKEHLGKQFSDVYATNAFPFIKPGRMNASIPEDDMKLAVQEFLLPQIEIIEPQIVICLGLDTFNAVRVSCGYEEVRPLDAAMEASFDFCCSRIVAVAHTGHWGTTNRKKRGFLPDEDWASIGRSLTTR